MDPEFLNTAGEHEHDSSVTSLSIIQPGDVDLDAVQSWVSDILQTKGADIYRMKGVLSIADTEQKFVYQVSSNLSRTATQAHGSHATQKLNPTSK